MISAWTKWCLFLSSAFHGISYIECFSRPHRASLFASLHKNDHFQFNEKALPLSSENQFSPLLNGDIFFDRRKFLRGFVSSFVISSAISTKSYASTKNPQTGILLPSEGEIESAIPTYWDEKDNPFASGSGSTDNQLGNTDSSMFTRLDKTSDSIFYKDARFVEHVDESAVKTMTNYISSSDILSMNDAVLDLCSSWTSHIDVSTREKLQLRRVSGLGMNAEELKKNEVLTDYIVQDLNSDANPKLPYESESFNVVLCQLSIDYLIHPLEVMKEISRVLKPGGKVVILFSNRLFLSKAVGIWTGADDIDHAYIVGSYLHYSSAGFENIKAKDLSSRKKGRGEDRPIIGDPLYAVTATINGRAT